MLFFIARTLLPIAPTRVPTSRVSALQSKQGTGKEISHLHIRQTILSKQGYTSDDILKVIAFPGNETHEFDIASTMLFDLQEDFAQRLTTLPKIVQAESIHKTV